MGLQSTIYNNYEYAEVTKMQDFFSTRLPEMSKVRALFENCKSLFNLPATRVLLAVAQGERIYRITLLSPDASRSVMGWLVYIPEGRRLDMYLPVDPTIPVCQWKDKKPIFKNYPSLYDRAGFSRIFDRLLNAI